MAFTDYQKAQKLGEKAYKSCTSKGLYPYLPVLEDMLSEERSCEQVKLGLVEIPVELIAGTYTSGRTTAFSNDFYPLLDTQTEFASKWSNLYDSLIENGQRDPIVAFEYMNRFYVVEGNKRVSVLKFIGAVTIEGNVVRIIPQKNDSKANKVYFEFLDFYEKTKINYIILSGEGAYEKLLRHIHPDEETPVSEEELVDLKAIYNNFKSVYKKAGGEKLNSTVGDVLLKYFDIFGYDEIREKSSDEMRKDIAKIWSEFLILSDDKPLSVIADPADDPQKKPIVPVKLPIPAFSGNQPLKVAFVYFKEPSVSGWSYSHEMGRGYIERVFGDKVKTNAFFTNDSSDIELLEKIHDEGYKVIFTTTPVLSGISLKSAVMHPESVILNCSINTAFSHVRTYYLRIYEAKFITGAVAGIMTETNSIGYIADYPIFGTPASINAFALGVKLVNPRAKVYLEWSSVKGARPLESFGAHGVDIISNKDLSAPVNNSREFGLYGISGDNCYNLCMPVWNWGVMYETLLRSIMNGTWKNTGAQGLNYYWGMASDAIDVIFSEKLPSGTKQLLWILKTQIASNVFSPFSGEIHDAKGNLRNEGSNSLSFEEIINMNWFVDNVVGSIPDKSELDESSLELFSQLGIKSESRL